LYYIAGRKLYQKERRNPAVAQTMISVTADGQVHKSEELPLLSMMAWELYMK
jgi:hypothetical protein